MENDYSLPVIYAIYIKMNWQLYVKGESFLRLNVNLFTDVDNRERGRSRDKNKGDVFCWKKNMKIFVTDVRK